MNTKDLAGDDLNRAVALALGHKPLSSRLVCQEPNDLIDEHSRLYWLAQPDQKWFIVPAGGGLANVMTVGPAPDYAGDIAKAWPIIVANKIEISWAEDEAYCNMYERDGAGGESFLCGGDDANPIVAAMRCFVASKLGEEVNLENT